MASRLEQTLVAGKLVRRAPDPIKELLLAKARAGEVLVALLETASEQNLRSGAGRIWIALTDRRALLLATHDDGDSWADVVDPATMSHRGRLGRDEITVGERRLKCPLLRGGNDFKHLIQLAEGTRGERLLEAATLRMEEQAPAAAAALAEAGLAGEPDDPDLLALRARALLADERHSELPEALAQLLGVDPELSFWKELHHAIDGNVEVLWMLYEAAQRTGTAAPVRARLVNLRARRPSDDSTARLAITMDADEGSLESGLQRATKWQQDHALSHEGFLACCEVLNKAGLHTEPLYRHQAVILGQLGRQEEALAAVQRGLALEETPDLLRVQARILVESNRAGEAVAPLERLLQLAHDDAWVRANLGQGLEALGRFDEAIDCREVGLLYLCAEAPDGDRAAAERQALARLHRTRADFLSGEEKQVRLACATLLEQGFDWAARMHDPPRIVLAGTDVHTEVEIIAARQLAEAPIIASLSYQETVVDGKQAWPATAEAPASVMEEGIAGQWPTARTDRDRVETEPGRTRVRYDIGREAPTNLDQGLARGHHQARVALPVPADVPPSHGGDRTRGELLLELTPPGASFPIPVGSCHPLSSHQEPQTPAVGEGTGKHPLTVTVANPAWSLGQQATLKLSARLAGDRQPTRIEVALVATERMRTPHKGERALERLAWTMPIFDYEQTDGSLHRLLHLDLPRQAPPSWKWTWFELTWQLQVSLLRKDKSEATAEVPILLRYAPLPAGPHESDKKKG
jgi:tetratricopeptide (TPR) repeat protein